MKGKNESFPSLRHGKLLEINTNVNKYGIFNNIGSVCTA
jgi:hypothetical protein